MKHKFNYFLFWFFIGFYLISFSPVIASGSEENKKIKSMITELEKKIDNADKKMIAHPSFIKELRALVKKYKSQLRELFFKDTFKDGNFNKNPKWVVKSGEFSVNKAKRLTSFVQMPSYETKTDNQPEQKKSLEAEAVGVLLDSFFGSKKSDKPVQKKSEKAPETIQPAYIYTKKVFPPAFEINMKFKSSQAGEMDIILLGSKNLIPRYYLKIKANHSEDDPIEIVRESNSRKFVVGASTKFPIINDGKFHNLTWVRLTNGAMNVLIDKKTVLQTYETYYRDNFTGFGVVNNGGSFEWDSFKIFKALKPKTN